ncbi:MAG: hypothetical protein C0P66_011140, partial [Bacillaceae bacterium]
EQLCARFFLHIFLDLIKIRPSPGFFPFPAHTMNEAEEADGQERYKNRKNCKVLKNLSASQSPPNFTTQVGTNWECSWKRLHLQ